MSNPQDEDVETRTPLLNAEHVFQKKVKNAWAGFVDFALRDNVLEVAIGLMYVRV